MIKKYSAKSCISISIKLPTGGSTHVSFAPKTGGGSVFYTDNEKIQEGLENHSKYGKLFKLDSEQDVTASKPAKEVKPIVTDATSNTDTDVEENAYTAGLSDGTDGDEGPAALIEKEVTCNDDAKDYLAEKFNVSRSKLRNREQIDSAAEANGVKFIWK